MPKAESKSKPTVNCKNCSYVCARIIIHTGHTLYIM